MSDLERRLARGAREAFGETARIERIEPLAGDASSRRYARIWLHGDRGAPERAIAMLLADRGVALSTEELAILEGPASELPFLNVHRFLAGIGVAVPEVYLDRTDEGFLLLEDVGDLTLREAVEGAPPEEVERLFRLAIDQLLVLQVRGTSAPPGDCIAFRQAFDERLFVWEFEHFLEFGLPTHASRTERNEDLAVLRAAFQQVASFLDAQPRHLNHRDYHAWNLHVHEGAIRVIDFQDALLAPAPYDLATLLGDRDTRSVVSPELEQRLLEYYAEGWANLGGQPWTLAELREVYLACALQKAFKVVGRFHYLASQKGKTGYLRFLPPTLAQIRRLLEVRPDWEQERRVLAKLFPELAP